MIISSIQGWYSDMPKQSKLDLGLPDEADSGKTASAQDFPEDIDDPREGRIYTVSGISKHIKNLIEHNPDLVDIWVRGEVSNFKKHGSGHIYFSIKDEYALLNCVIFHGTMGRLRFEMDHGMKIIAHGTIGVYMPQGRYQFVIDNVRPDGLGALHQAYLKLREKLEKEGLFDDAHKVPLPRFPEVIGIATSETGAAVRDIINIIKRRYPKVIIYLMPTLVQGDGAANSIVKSIKTLDNMKEIDVIIIGRGGGSLEDLWAFNEEPVVRAIFNARHPIISAVGHQTDYTLSDFVADIRAPTPSAAAEIVVPDRLELMSEITGTQNYLKQIMFNILTQYKLEYNNLIESFAFQRPFERVREYQQHIDELQSRMKTGLTNIIRIKKLEASALGGKLASLDPTAVLSRGYSIALKGSGSCDIISSIEGLEGNTGLNIIVSDGDISAEIKDLKRIDKPITHLLSRLRKDRNIK